MKKFIVIILALFMLASCAGMRKDTLESDMEIAVDVGASANSYTVETEFDPSTDYILGIVDYGGSWAVRRIDLTSLYIPSYIFGLTNSVILTNCEGAQDDGASGSNLLFMTDDGESFPVDGLIGMTLYNITDVSSCTIGDNDADDVYCVGYSVGVSSGLSGGTDDDWDDGDVWAIAPGPKQSGMIFYINAATTILHPSTAGYTAGYYSTGANVIKVDPQSSSMQFTLNGAPTGTNGEELDSPGAAGDFIMIHNQSATVGVTLGRSGTWIDGGES